MSMLILPDYPGMMVQLVEGDTVPTRVHLVSTAAHAACPQCGATSQRIHHSYIRELQDIPFGETPVKLIIEMHRFHCDQPTCRQSIFCERAAWAPPYQRRSARCIERILRLAWEMSASAAHRVAERIGMPVSRSTINRWRLKEAERPPFETGPTEDAGSGAPTPR